MARSMREGEGRRPDLALCIGVALVATLLASALFGFLAEGLGVPLSYSEDTLLTSSSIKSIIDNGQPYSNPYLGAPGTAELFDFPGTDGIFLLEMWLLSLVTSDFAVLLNLFVLLTYPLIALAAAWAMRRLGYSRWASFVFALLYAFLPYHQSRAVLHQSLSAYFVVPLAVALVVVVVFDVRERVPDASPKKSWQLPLWAWLVVLAIGTSGIYYAYFAIALAIVAAVISAWASRDLRRLVPAGLITAAIVAVIVVQMVPSFVYWQREGANSLSSARQPAEADLYALRLTQLVFPVTGHRIPQLAAAKEQLKQSYVGLLGPSHEGIAYDSSLGVTGALGLFILLFWALTAPFRRPPPLGDETPAKLSVLGVTAFLLATVGGVGGLVAFLGFDSIRAYDRITPYIGFMALCATAWLADTAAAGIRKRARAGATAIVIACFALVLVVGLLDQTTPSDTPAYDEIRSEFESDRDFVAGIEAVLDDDAMVFQLPYIAFPESAPIEGMDDYDPLRMYLHSESIHWSAGAFKGREDAAWQAEVAALDTPELLAELAEAGFEGVVIDRDGYADGGRGIEADLRAGLEGANRLESPDGSLVFYTLP